MRQLSIVAVIVFAIGCSSSGKKPLLETDGTLTGEDLSSDSSTVPDDVSISEDLSVPADQTATDVVFVDEWVADQVAPDDLAPLDIGGVDDLGGGADVEPVEEVVEEVVGVDIVPLGPTCGDIFKCGLAKGCGVTSDACWETCFGEADETELDAFLGISECVAEFCEALPAAEQGECLMSQCIGPVFECLGGDGSMNCLDAFQCIQGCGQDDGLCYFECIEGTDEGSLELLLEMSYATEDEMFALMIECTGGNGDLNCGETVGCIMSCEDQEPPDPSDPADDPAMDCMIGCLSQSSAEGAEQLLAFLECSEEQCPDGMDDCPGMFICLGECPGLTF